MKPGRSALRTARLALCVFAIGSLSACASTPADPPRPAASTPAELPEYATIRDAHNTRVARLAQISAIGNTVFRYRNAEGREELDQGDLLFRYTAPGKLALVIRKLSETYVWIGADETRYWFIDRLSDPHTAYVGRHDRLNAEKASRLAMPVPPRDMLTLLALRPMPDAAAGMRWSDDGASVLVRVPALLSFLSDGLATGGAGSYWVYAVEPRTLRPSGVALVVEEAEGDRTLLIAEIGAYARAARSAAIGAGTDAPLMASDVRIRVPGEPDSIRVQLDSTGIVMRGSRPSVFSFEDRVDDLGIGRVVDLDEEDTRIETIGGTSP